MTWRWKEAMRERVGRSLRRDLALEGGEGRASWPKAEPAGRLVCNMASNDASA